MPIPTPPTSPDAIDTALTYVIDTGRTNTWVMSGHAKLKGSVSYGIADLGEDGPFTDVGFGYYNPGVTSLIPCPYSGGGSPFDLSIAVPGSWVFADIQINGPVGSVQYYRIHMEINSDPIDVIAGTGTGNCGLQWTFTTPGGSTVGNVANNATLGSRLVGPTAGAGQHAEICTAVVDADWTATLSVKEVFKSSGRDEGEYQWILTNIALSCSGSTLTYAVPSGYQFPIDSTCDARIYANCHDSNNPAYGAGPTDQWLGYTPDFYAEVSNWALSGTRNGANFRALSGGGGLTLPAVATRDLTIGTVDARKIRIQIDPAGVDTPVSSTPGAAGYNWYITENSLIATTTAMIRGEMQDTLVLAPPCPNTIAAMVEKWWNGGTFNRAPTDTDYITMAGEVSAWNALVATGGTYIPMSFGVLAWNGPALSGPFVIPGPTLTFTPERLITPLPSALSGVNYAQYFIANTGDPFYTGSLGRDIGTLTLTKPGLILPAISLAVASNSMGGANTDTYTADLGNWACERWLTIACTGISLTGGHKATLTVVQASGASTVYTLSPDAGTGVAIVDLACPDNQALPALGVGLGLVSPVPSFVSDGSGYYKRSSTDVPTPATDSHVASITLTVPGPSETFTISSIAFVSYTGNDAWVDPRGDGSGYSQQVAGAAIFHGPYHLAYLGSLTILADGKQALHYPYYGKLTNYSGYVHYNSGYEDYYDVPLMASDLLYDLGVLNCGVSGSFTATFTPPGGGPAVTANNAPVGMLTADDLPFGSNAYSPWVSSTETLTFRRELTSLTVPTYNCKYHLEGRWYHGGGMEGLAIAKASKGQAIPGKVLKITHRQSIPLIGFPPTYTAASNPPTGVSTVTADSGGFWRSVHYDDGEAPTIAGMQIPPDIPVPYLSTDDIPANISGLTYIHFITLFLVAGAPGVCCLAPSWGSFLMAGPRYVSGEQAGILFWRRDIGVPTSWDASAVVISSTAGDLNPCMAYDHRGRLSCQFERTGTGVMEVVSDDDGDTWGTPVMTITNGQYPRIRTGKDGSLYRVAYVDDGTSSSTGTLKGEWQAPGDAAPSAAFPLVKADGVTPIAVQLGGFDIDHMAESAGRWILTVLEVGNTSPTEWVSADDDGGTFVPV